MTEQTLLIAQVAVEKTAYHFDRLFSYIIPQTLVRKVAVGSRVLVPFAKGNRARQGFVLRLAAAEGNILRFGRATYFNCRTCAACPFYPGALLLHVLRRS